MSKDPGFRDKLNNVTVGPVPHPNLDFTLRQIESTHLEAIEAETFDESYVTWIQKHRAIVLADAIEKLVAARAAQLKSPLLPLDLIAEVLEVKHAPEMHEVMGALCRAAAKRYPTQAAYWKELALEHRLYHDIWIKVKVTWDREPDYVMVEAGEVLDRMRSMSCGMDQVIEKLVRLDTNVRGFDYDRGRYYHSSIKPADQALNEQIHKIFTRETPREVPAAPAG